MPSEATVAAIQRARQELARGGPGSCRTPGDFERVTLPTADADILRDLMLVESARVVIEIGLGYGTSALAIGESLSRLPPGPGRLVIVDPFQDQYNNVGRDALLATGLGGRLTLLAERSQLALPRMVADGFRADAAFIDGSHRFDDVFVDMYFLTEILRPGGLVVLDDCHWPSVGTALRYFTTNAGWAEHPIGLPTRLRAARVSQNRDRSEPDEFAPDDFTPFS
jgi:predicted O-methyltransferase YrrM